MDFLRFAQPAIIATAGALVAVLIVAFLAVRGLKAAGEDGIAKGVKIGTWILSGLLVFALLWQLLLAASVNNVNRSTIDRSGIDTQRYSETPTP